MQPLLAVATFAVQNPEDPEVGNRLLQNLEPTRQVRGEPDLDRGSWIISGADEVDPVGNRLDGPAGTARAIFDCPPFAAGLDLALPVVRRVLRPVMEHVAVHGMRVEVALRESLHELSRIAVPIDCLGDLLIVEATDIAARRVLVRVVDQELKEPERLTAPDAQSTSQSPQLRMVGASGLHNSSAQTVCSL